MAAIREENKVLKSGKKDRQWVVDYFDQAGQRRRKKFKAKSQAAAFHLEVSLAEHLGWPAATNTTPVAPPPPARMLFETLDEWLEQELPRLSSGSYFGKVPPKKVQGSQQLARRAVKRFRESCGGDLPLADVGLAKLDDYRNLLRSLGCLGQTISRNESPLRSFFRWAVEIREYLDDTPFRKMRKLQAAPRRETSMLTVEELTAVLDKAEPWHRAVLFFLAETGCRRAQACHVRWEDYRPEESLILFRPYEGFTTKNGSEQILPISPVLKQYLDELKVQSPPREHGLIFCGPLGERIRPDRLTHETGDLLKAVVKRELGAACHAFRRTAASLWHESGASTMVIAKLLGHSAGSGCRVVESCYVKTVDSFLRQVIQKSAIKAPKLH